MPGREVVILGSGDIGLIMARRMTLEGAKVKVVAELMPFSGGLQRNIVQCLDDFDIPLKLSHTVIDIQGKERVTGITLAEVDENRKPIPGTEEFYACDTLLLSCGLIPENELSGKIGVELSRITSGPVVNESLETNVPVYSPAAMYSMYMTWWTMCPRRRQGQAPARQRISGVRRRKRIQKRFPSSLWTACATPCPRPSVLPVWRIPSHCVSVWALFTGTVM